MTSHNGLISVNVGPNDRSVELCYRRRSFALGLVVSALGWIALAATAIARCVRVRAHDVF